MATRHLVALALSIAAAIWMPTKSSAHCDTMDGPVIGLQFHLETTPESAGSMISHCRNELIEGSFIQSEDELRRVPEASYAEINLLMAEVLSYITGPRDVG